MNLTIPLRGNNINLRAKLHAIKIFNDDELSSALEQNTESITDELVSNIKSAYLNVFNCDFEVSDASIAVEIWAHMYAEKFAEAVKSFSSLKLIDDVADKILHHAEIIDIGERGHDDNRFVWDSLAALKSPIAALLFRKQDKQ